MRRRMLVNAAYVNSRSLVCDAERGRVPNARGLPAQAHYGTRKTSVSRVVH